MHIPVLTNQVLAFLDPQPGKVFIDCTLGTGGHTEALLKHMADQGAVYGIDADSRNLDLARKRLSNHSNVHFIRDNFENLEEIGSRICAEEGKISGILFDLGLSSLHVEEAIRGFSFQREGPLDMRFDTNQPLTAADIVNTYPLEKLIFIFQTYGEEKFSHRIARKIVESRRRKRFTTTSELADTIANIFSKGAKNFYFKRHPATRIFQAIRIAANREIEVLEKGLVGSLKVLSQGGRIVVIAYHSLEDRIVKNFFRDSKRTGILKILTKKPLQPGQEEMEKNPRSRSAKLRAAEKLTP